MDPSADGLPLCMYYEVRFVHSSPAAAAINSESGGVGGDDEVVEVRQRCSESLRSYLKQRDGDMDDHMMDTITRQIFRYLCEWNCVSRCCLFVLRLSVCIAGKCVENHIQQQCLRACEAHEFSGGSKNAVVGGGKLCGRQWSSKLASFLLYLV